MSTDESIKRSFLAAAQIRRDGGIDGTTVTRNLHTRTRQNMERCPAVRASRQFKGFSGRKVRAEIDVLEWIVRSPLSGTFAAIQVVAAREPCKCPARRVSIR